MKHLTTLFTVVALSGAAVAGPVQKQALTTKETAQLQQAQAKSQEALKVQAGNWADDHGAVVVACIVGVAALTLGIVAIAND